MKLSREDHTGFTQLGFTHLGCTQLLRRCNAAGALASLSSHSEALRCHVIESNGVNIALKLLMSYRPEARESSLAVSSGVKLSIQERKREWLLTFTHQSGY